MWNNITRFATDRLEDLRDAGVTISDGMKHAAIQLRDGVIVPAIDTAMEAGVIPADAGMFGRYLTGTNTPLTRMPSNVKKGETELVNYFTQLNETKANDPIHQARLRLNELYKLQDQTGVDIRAHNMGIQTYDADQVAEYQRLRNEAKQIINKLNVGEQIKVGVPATSNMHFETQLEPFDPNNYNTSKYKGKVSLYHANDGEYNATNNTLGQYVVKEGIIHDRYDFDTNNGFTTPGTTLESFTEPSYVSDGKFTSGGAFGASKATNYLANFAGDLSHKLGLIKPGSGYDVRLDTGRR